MLVGGLVALWTDTITQSCVATTVRERHCCTAVPAHRWQLRWQAARLIKVALRQAVHKGWLVFLIRAQKAWLSLHSLQPCSRQPHHHKVLPELLGLAVLLGYAHCHLAMYGQQAPTSCALNMLLCWLLRGCHQGINSPIRVSCIQHTVSCPLLEEGEQLGADKVVSSVSVGTCYSAPAAAVWYVVRHADCDTSLAQKLARLGV